jgi:hypothetical protein
MIAISIISKIKLPNKTIFEKYPKILRKGMRIQPFYSRGVTPYFGLFFISLYYMTCILQICLDYQNNMYFYYLFYNVITIPSAIAIFTILPLNSLKWIFLLNLNSRKVFTFHLFRNTFINQKKKKKVVLLQK